MKIIAHLADLLYRHQKKLEIAAIFLLCLTVSFRFSNFTTVWLWDDNIYFALVLVVLLILIALIWIQIEKNKTKNLIQQIKFESESDKKSGESYLEDLSSRQREVFELILKGKSNKEIMDELNIELSTLKTHINKIYKTLKVDTRKKLKQFDNLKNNQ